MEKENVSLDDFEKYLEVRDSGRTNMFDVGTVEMLSGLDRETIMCIMKNFGELQNKYRAGGINVCL